MSLIPENKTAEAAAIDCLLSDASIYSVPIREDHFSAPDHKLIFRAIKELSDEKSPVDFTTVRSRLESRGELENAGGDPSRFLKSFGGGDATLKLHYDHLELARRSRETVLHIRDNLDGLTSMETDPAAFAQELADLSAPIAVGASGDSVAEILAEMEEEKKSGVVRELFTTGLSTIDRHVRGGLERGELFVVGGRTGRGKSAVLINAAVKNADAGKKVIYYTLEMPKRSVLERMAAALCSVRVNANDRAFEKALAKVGMLDITIRQKLSTLPDIISDIRAEVRAGNCDVAVVDYVQRVTNPNDNREREVAVIAQLLKNVALAEDVVILTASQLNDQGALRESRAIGMEADVLAIINLKKDNEDTDDGILLDKFRRGESGVFFPAYLQGEFSRFVPAARVAAS